MSSRVQLQSPQLFWLAMLALAAALTAVVWLYRPQVKPLRAPWWWMLLGLRTVALAVLAISTLRPTILRMSEGSESGVVAVLIDQSRSMEVVDASRPPAELVQLAAAIDVLPANSRPGGLSELRRQIGALRQLVDEISRAHSELEYARLAGRGAEAPEIRLRQTRDQFASQLKSIIATVGADAAAAPLVDALTQVQRQPADPPDVWSGAVADQITEVTERLDAMQASADEKLYQSDAAVREACDSIAAKSRFDLVRLAVNGSSGLVAKLNSNHQPVQLFGFSDAVQPLQMPLDDARAEGVRSDPAGALREVRQRLALRRVTAAVVFSDGREVGSDTSGGPTWTEVPVIAVAAAPANTKDITIARVSCPASASVGQTIPISVELRASGFDGTTVQISLQTPGGQTLATTASITSGGAHAEMKLTLDHAGPQEFSVSVAPQPLEATTQNNRVSRVVKVISEKSRVALLGGIATWDYQHLRGALLRSPGLQVSSQLVDSQNSGPVPTQILEQDVVILSNLPASLLDARQWDAIRRLLSDQGGSVIMIISDPAVAASYESRVTTSSLLPWRVGPPPTMRVWPGEDAMFRVMPTGQDVIDAFGLADDDDVSRARWNELPPFYRFLAMPPLKPTARPLLMERESGLPVLTETRVGAGRVLTLTIDDAWRWRAAIGERDQDRFWLGLVRCAAQEPYAVSDGNLSFDADRLRIEPRQTLHVRARIRSLVGFENEELTEPPALKIVASSDGALVRTEEFAAVPGSPDRFELNVANLSEGEYELRLNAADRSLSLPLRVAPSDEAELRDVTGDEQALQRLVGPRGGSVIGLTELATLPQRLVSPRTGEPRFSELPLWDSPYLFLFVVGCLGVEWAVRKRVGLV